MNTFELIHELESVLLPAPVSPHTAEKGLRVFHRYPSNRWTLLSNSGSSWKVGVRWKRPTGQREVQWWNEDHPVWEQTFSESQIADWSMAKAVIMERVRQVKVRGYLIDSDFDGPPVDIFGDPMWVARKAEVIEDES